MREWADQAAHDEGRGERDGAAGSDVGPAVVGRGEIEDVLGEGEADAHHAGIDDAVEDAVELVATPPQQQDEERPLGRLLGDGCDHREAVGLARAADHAEGLEDEGGRGRHEGAPQQSGDQQRARLGLIAVQPHEASDERADRKGRQERGERQGRRRTGQADDHRHGQPSQEDEHPHDDGEGHTVAAASGHDSTLTEPGPHSPFAPRPSAYSDRRE